MSRIQRKKEHIRHSLSTGQERTHGFEDIDFIHRSLPLTSVNEIDISTRIGELTLSSPIFINAMTGGGGEETLNINHSLALVANQCEIAMAVGSQTAAIRNPDQRKTYEIVRKVNPNGVVIANVGSDATIEDAKQAVEMIQADALQIHLNVIQELVMPEGDRDFTKVLNRIEEFIHKIEVPIIVKEVGFGMSKETAQQLYDIGVKIIDIGGFGGTNFAKVENERRHVPLNIFNEWGIKTTHSLAEVNEIQKPPLSILASGGLQTALDLAKSLALGASAGGFAGYFLKILKTQGEDHLTNHINELKNQLRFIMTALGTISIPQLQQAPLVITGETYHWLNERGIQTKKYSQRKVK